MAQEGVICWGPRRGKQHTLVLLDEWIPNSRNLEGEKALAELASRYIKSHGPVTEYDFASWSGLTVTTSRKALRMVEEGFHKTKTDKHTWWFPEPIQIGQENLRGTYLLPGFDEMICGYKDRSSILTGEHEQSIILRNGILRPVIISDGKVVGSWKRTLKKDRVLIETAPFGTLTKNQEKEITEKVEEYASFLGRDADLQG